MEKAKSNQDINDQMDKDTIIEEYDYNNQHHAN